MSVFLLSMRLPKTSFVGTAAWFFMVVNYLKVPLQIFVWNNITRESLLFDVTMLPIIIMGAVLGVILVKKISEKHYKTLVYVMTLLSALLLFLDLQRIFGING